MHTLASEMSARARSRAQASDLDGLLTRCSKRGYRIAFGFLRNAADAEDAVQEALAISCRAHRQLTEPAALDAWFYRVLTRHCLRVLRRRRVGRTLGLRWFEPTAERESAKTPDNQKADRRIEQAQREAALVELVQRLPAKQMAAVVLRYGHGMSVGEVADTLGVGVGTAKTHLARAMRTLREHSLEHDHA